MEKNSKEYSSEVSALVGLLPVDLKPHDGLTSIARGIKYMGVRRTLMASLVAWGICTRALKSLKGIEFLQ